MKIAAVLFDLDGTVLDTAPDLLRALNVLRERRDLGPFPLTGFRARVSRGARAMLGAGLPGFVDADAGQQMALVEEFLAAYRQRIYAETTLFPGMAEALDRLQASGAALAIVTNKPEAMALDLLTAMALRERFAAIYGGDSLPERKPHPMPLLAACTRLAVDPAQALMVGDDPRDIDAGRAAGCTTVAVAWGYADADELPGWNADVVIAHPDELPALAGA